ncbi:TPA: phage tail protein, partial [Enterococcus faecium]
DQWMTNLSADVIKKTSVVTTTATQSQ